MTLRQTQKIRWTVALSVLVAVATGLVLTWIALEQAVLSVSSTSHRPGYPDEAEYNAWPAAELDRRVGLPFVNSQPAGDWFTTAVVQNSSAATATVVLEYFDTSGTLVADLQVSLPPMGSRSIPTPDGVSGSLMMSATQPIAAIAYESPMDLGLAGDGLMSYRGIGASGGDTDICLLPIIRDLMGSNSLFAVQNLTGITASIDITFYDPGGADVYSFSDSLPPYSAHWYDAADIAGLPSGFQGRADVHSSRPVAGVVNTYNELTGAAVAHNNRRHQRAAFDLYLPHLIGDLASYIILYSPSGMVTSAAVTLYDGQGTAVSTYSPGLLPPEASKTIGIGGGGWSPPVPSGFRGSGRISSEQPVGALVNTVWSDSQSLAYRSTSVQADAPTLTGYSASSVGDTLVYVPLLRKAPDDALTQLAVQNVMSATAAVTVTYYDEAGTQAGTASAEIPPYASVFFDQGTSGLPTPFSGAAVVASTEPVAVVGFISRQRQLDMPLDEFVYLPYIPSQWPPIPDSPVLNPISNDGEQDYSVSWAHADRADTYTLEEATDEGFSDAKTVYHGTGTRHSVTDKDVGTYYYRAKATNSWGDSGWSNVESATVAVYIWVYNDTGDRITVELVGIEKKAFATGLHYWRTIPPGPRTYKAWAWCGSGTWTDDFQPGSWVLEFWCASSAGSESGGLVGRPGQRMP